MSVLIYKLALWEKSGPISGRELWCNQGAILDTVQEAPMVNGLFHLHLFSAICLRAQNMLKVFVYNEL